MAGNDNAVLRPLQWLRATASGLVYAHACLLWVLHVSTNGNINNVSAVYDGFGTDGRLLLCPGPNTKMSETICLPRPIQIQQGLYVTFGSNVVEVCFGIEPQQGT